MKNKTLIRVLIILSASFWSLHLVAFADQPLNSDVQIVQQAGAIVDGFHSGADDAGNRIHVVYFHAADREPLDQWEPRLQRILKDVSDFYQTELAQYGVETEGLPFEKTDDGRFRVHLVQGQLRSDQYQYDSGKLVQREIKKSLAEIDLRRAHVLAIHGLCDVVNEPKTGPRYIFHAPYYGQGNQKSGFCHAADCVLLDPAQLTNQANKIRYTEHYYPLRVQTIARFNSWYLGGIAHELGHGIGLPHDRGRANGRWQRGTSLMGGGNLFYREDAWGGKKPAYLSTATTLRMLASPLITQSDRQRFANSKAEIVQLQVNRTDEGARFGGKVKSQIPCYAVIASLWRKPKDGRGGGDHKTTTFPVLVKDGKFQVSIPTSASNKLKPGNYRLRFSMLLANGAERALSFQVPVDKGVLDVQAIVRQAAFPAIVDSIRSGAPNAKLKFTERQIADSNDESFRTLMKVLNQLLDPPQPVNLSTTDHERVSLSDAAWDEATVGWGKIGRNHRDLEQKDAGQFVLRLKGTAFEKGLYAHSKSRVTFTLNKRWKTFAATVGIQEGAADQGSAVFIVKADGKEVFRSGVLGVGKTESVKVDLTGVDQLELIADGGEGHVHNSWAVWATPFVTK